MKKGLLTLVVLAVFSVGAVGFAATPELWGIPDIVIGDDEDSGVTDNCFVFTDAFAFADYFHWVDSGAKNLKWHYTNCEPIGLLTVNDFAEDYTAIADITVAGTIANASFRNIMLTPVGGPNTLSPVGWLDTTDVAVVTFMADNFLVVDEQDFTVYTVDSTTDALTNEYYKSSVSDTVMTSDPGWTSFLDASASPAVSPPYGLSGCDGTYNATSNALTLSTDGDNNDFGAWVSPDIAYVDGAAYMFTASLFCTPIYPEAVVADPPTGTVFEYMPKIRLRVNVKAETVVGELEINSLGSANAEISTDCANPSTDVLIFDPRDQSNMPYGLQSMYFSFDLIDFEAHGREYPLQKDDQGTVGLTQLLVETYPAKMLWREATPRKSYPTGAKFTDNLSDYVPAEYSMFGGVTCEATTDGAGNLALVSEGVTAGFAIWALAPPPGTAAYLMSGDTDDFYAMRISCKSSNTSVPWLRFRLYEQNYQRLTTLNIRPTEGTGAQLPGVTGDTYSIFLEPVRPQFDNMRVLFAIDLIDFLEDGGDSIVTLTGAKLYSADFPTAP